MTIRVILIKKMKEFTDKRKKLSNFLYIIDRVCNFVAIIMLKYK